MSLVLSLTAALLGSQEPRFQRHDIDAFAAGYQVAVADVNADGKPDVVALSTEADRVDWYENPSWKLHPVARTARNIDLALRDIDGDGRLEIALASGFYFSESSRGGEIQWLGWPEKPGDLWKVHGIAVDPVTHRLRWGDLDGDGRAELIHAPLFGPGSSGAADAKPAHLRAFKVPLKPAEGPWDVWKIDETLTVLHGIHVCDLDGDGRDEILAASFEGIHRLDFEGAGPQGVWRRVLMGAGAPPADPKPGTARGSSEVIPVNLGPKRTLMAAIEPWHGHEVVVYEPGEGGGPWRRCVLDEKLSEGHALVAADLGGDGVEEIVAGWRGSGGGLALYKAADSRGEQWNRTDLDRGIAVEGLVAADLNLDGSLDLVAIAGRTNNLAWYENVQLPIQVGSRLELSLDRALIGESKGAGLRLATFRCDATPPPGEPLIWATPLVKAEDPLWAKGVLLESGSDRYVLCTVDWCEICNDTDLAFRESLAAGAGTAASRVVVHSVHQHASAYADKGAHELLDKAPNPLLRLSDKFLEDLSGKLRKAAEEARGRLEPFDRVGVGEAKVERVASTRRLRGEDGKIIVRYSGGGADPKLAEAAEGPIDPLLKTVTLARGEKALVRLHYYATHPQTFCCDGRASADFVGAAREALERKEGVFQLYFTGCAGDVTAGKYNDGTPRARAELGERLLAGMEAAVRATRFGPALPIAWRTASLSLPLRQDKGYAPEDLRAKLMDTKGSDGSRVYAGAMALAFAGRKERPLLVSSLDLGGARVLHLPGEPMLEFQLFAQKLKPESFVAVAGYCDCGPGYICTDAAYVEGGYEPTASNAAPGSEALLKKAIRDCMENR